MIFRGRQIKHERNRYMYGIYKHLFVHQWKECDWTEIEIDLTILIGSQIYYPSNLIYTIKKHNFSSIISPWIHEIEKYNVNKNTP